MEICEYPSHSQRVVVKDFAFRKNLRANKVSKCAIYIELGIAEYADNGEQLSWTVLADKEPIELNIYYEPHIFRKNIIKLK